MMKTLILFFVAAIAGALAGHNVRSSGGGGWQGSDGFSGQRSSINGWSGIGTGSGRSASNGWRTGNPADSNQGGWAAGRSARGQSSGLSRFANQEDNANGWGNTGWSNDGGWSSSW